MINSKNAFPCSRILGNSKVTAAPACQKSLFREGTKLIRSKAIRPQIGSGNLQIFKRMPNKRVKRKGCKSHDFQQPLKIKIL